MRLSAVGRTGITGCLAAALVLAAGCGGSQISTKIVSPYALDNAREEDRAHTQDVLGKIEERNRTIEADRQWISKAYNEFMIPEFASVSEDDYAGYAQYLDHGAVYVIVHPAYYTFFSDHGLFSEVPGPIFPVNAMEKFLGEASYSAKTRLIKAQEKMLRDFLEYASTERRLVLLILPNNYRTYQSYKFKDTADEYMRFINEVTNESASVLYFYSKKPNRGSISDKDRKKLLKFLYAIRAKEILVGGGYVGRCLEDFYKDVEQNYSEDKIFLVPEITAISPVDVSSDVAADMLLSDGTLNVPKLTANIKANVLGNQQIIPKTRNLRHGEAGP